MTKCLFWGSEGEAFKAKKTVQTVKNGGGRIMLWGYFAASGKSEYWSRNILIFLLNSALNCTEGAVVVASLHNKILNIFYVN